MQYDNFCFWYAKLLKWTRKNAKDHKDIYAEMYRMGKEALTNYVNSIGGIMDPAGPAPKSSIPYVELPGFTFSIANHDDNSTITVSGRARINACLGYPGKTHHTKIWITLINVDPVVVNSVRLNALFEQCHKASSGIGDSIASIYAKALKQTLADSDVDYYIEVRTASVVDDEISSEEFNKLIAKSSSQHPPSPIVRDIRAWANCEDLVSATDTAHPKKEFQLVKIGNSMSIMAVNTTPRVAYIGAVALLDNAVVQAPGKSISRRKLLHDQFLPTALHLTYAV